MIDTNTLVLVVAIIWLALWIAGFIQNIRTGVFTWKDCLSSVQFVYRFWWAIFRLNFSEAFHLVEAVWEKPR